MSIASGVKTLPAPLSLDKVILERDAPKIIRLTIIADGKVEYWEVFKDWNTALDIAPQLARQWVYEWELPDHEGST